MDVCNRLGGLQLAQTFSAMRGSKLFHLFDSRSGDCGLPLLSYAHVNSENQVEGWILQRKTARPELEIVWQDGGRQALSLRRNNVLNSEIFAALPEKTYRLWHFTTPYSGAFHLELTQPKGAVTQRSALYRF
jgi:hypothetical protein